MYLPMPPSWPEALRTLIINSAAWEKCYSTWETGILIIWQYLIHHIHNGELETKTVGHLVNPDEVGNMKKFILHCRIKRDGRKEKEISSVLSQRRGSYLRKIYFSPISKDG